MKKYGITSVPQIVYILNEANITPLLKSKDELQLSSEFSDVDEEVLYS